MTDFADAFTDIIKAFQRRNGLTVDGIIGPVTRAAFEDCFDFREKPPVILHRATLSGFLGDTNWIHAREGHNGGVYWPGGISGLTLDPGYDIHHGPITILDRYYAALMTQEQYDMIRSCRALAGTEARDALRDSALLRSIRITEDYATEIFPELLKPYWEQIIKRFPHLLRRSTPPEVQTVMLSLAYNRGPNNIGLAVCRKLISQEWWDELGKTIANMQQNHSLPGIRERRRLEGQYIIRRKI